VLSAFSAEILDRNGRMPDRISETGELGSDDSRIGTVSPARV
jgi:hypothetical protein